MKSANRFVEFIGKIALTCAADFAQVSQSDLSGNTTNAYAGSVGGVVLVRLSQI